MARRKRTAKYSIGGLLILLAFFLYYSCNPERSEPEPETFDNEGYVPKPKKVRKKKDRQVNRYLTVFQGKVVGIKDGDTFEVLYEGQPERVRLAGIDCPEKSQPFGNNAKHYASVLCFGKMVTVTSDGKRDRYGRIVGEIVTEDGANINQMLVKEGLAWHYKQYSADEKLADFERTARLQRKGLWSDNEPIAPWDWRRHKREMNRKKAI
ncbi:thermonuclease family protein [Flavobacterium sp. J372]|uniref:thermonuclease family protein n=1 Tax=Flavobacterium sp. J372 TaxID=2898436 RepID=UPI002150927F|nr:thermonuclease family protein [Flavobacterium sp. J372]MCR5863152.1 thermonuclease family protein [Flavobacterium sp. J372]